MAEPPTSPFKPISSRVIDKQPLLVRVVTEEWDVEGQIFIMINHRPSDVLNDENDFVPMSDVKITPRGGGETRTLPFIALSKRTILYLTEHPDAPRRPR